MTWNRDKATDRAATQRLLSDPTARAEFKDVVPNWLGHTKGSAAIDWDLLEGVSMSQLLNHRKTVAAVNKHLDHLEEAHGLEIDRAGIYRFRHGPAEGIVKSSGEIGNNTGHTTNSALFGSDSHIPPPAESGVSLVDQVSAEDLEPFAHARESLADVQTGAGFGDPAENKIVESAAVGAVTRAYEAAGWSVRSVERDKCGFDLACTRNGQIEDVEVKGVRGSAPCFLITAGEVEQARTNQNFVLVVVTSAVSESATLTRYSGAEFIQRFKLSPIQYRASLKP